MKKLTLTVIISALCLLSFAQTPFTAQHSDILTMQTSEEEAAVKNALDDQARLLYSGDTEVFSKLWKDDPKNFVIMSGTAGEFLEIDNEQVKKNYALNKPRNATPKCYNYKIKIVGNVALAHYDQDNMYNNGVKKTEHNLQILEKVNGEWKIIGKSIHPNNLANEEKPEDIAKQWVTEYNKDSKLFFEKNCSKDFIASNTGIDGGKFFGKEFIINRAKNAPSDLETTNMTSFQSGDLAVVVGNLIWHHKQPDGSDKPDKTVSTWVMQKKEGKWWYAGHHISPLKE